MRKVILCFSLTLIVVVIFLMQGCGKERKFNYYRVAEIDGRSAIVGRYPVPDKMSKKVNCYHFVHNDKGKLVKVEYLKGGKIAVDAKSGVAKIIIEKQEGFEKRIYHDAKGKPIEDKKGVYSIRLKLNKKGNPETLFNYDRDGNLTEDSSGVAQYLWTLDKNGRRIKSYRINKEGKRIVDKNGMYEMRWKYDKYGNVIEWSNHGKDGQLLEDNVNIAIMRRKYDKQGNTI
ncbi:MAG: hypothetical protein AABX51_02105, partial [Nanoarchaeota archaeon]